MSTTSSEAVSEKIASAKTPSILQVCHDTKGPFINVCKQYVDALAAYQVTTVFLKGSRDEQAASRVGGHRVVFLDEGKDSEKNDMRGLKLAPLWQMCKFLKQNRFDIAVLHRYKPLYIIGLLSIIFPIPRILAVAHEFDFLKRLPRRLVIRMLSNIKIAGVSNIVKSDIAKSCPALERTDRLSTLYNSIDSAQLEKLVSRDEARQRLGLASSCVYIGTVGRLVKKKNHALLIRALAEIDNINLVLIGDGPEKESLVLLTQSLGLEDRVTFTGAVDEAYRYLKALDLFVLSSGEKEAFGIVLLEAMQAKVAVLSSDAPGPKEVLADTGRYFQSGNEGDLAREILTTLDLTEEEKAKQITKAFDRQAQEFNEQAFQRRLFTILELPRP